MAMILQIYSRRSAARCARTDMKQGVGVGVLVFLLVLLLVLFVLLVLVLVLVLATELVPTLKSSDRLCFRIFLRPSASVVEFTVFTVFLCQCLAKTLVFTQFSPCCKM